MLAAPAAATEAWNYSDHQRAKDYEDKPEYLKRLGIVIMHPGEAPRDAQGNRNPGAHFIPIPNEFMPFVEAGREGFHRIAGVGPARNVGQLASDVGQEVSPIGAARSVEAGIGGMIPAGPGTGLFDFGFRDGMVDAALLQHPLGVTLLPDGSVAVCDTYNGAVRRIADGVVTTRRQK